MQRLFGSMNGAGAGAQAGVDTPTADTAEMVYISSLALLKVEGSVGGWGFGEDEWKGHVCCA